MSARLKPNIFEGRKIKVLLHLLAWTIILALPLYFSRRAQFDKHLFWIFYLNTLLSGVIFYTNYLFLVPRFYFNSKRLKYLLSIVIFLALFYFISDQSNQYVFTNIVDKGIRQDNQSQQAEGQVKPPADEERRQDGPPAGERKAPMHPSALRLPMEAPMKGMHLYNYAFSSLVLIFFSLGLRVMERQSDIEKMHKELEKQKLNSELAFLKNQISPHFFFNTLNNIYSLIAINAEDSQKAVLKLSKMMRYLLYESEKGDAKLSSEIDFMNNYIDLMRLRMSDKVSLKIEFPEKYVDHTLPPLLFISFIENAFKHGISFREKSYIEMLLVSDSNGVYFRSINSISPAAGDGQSESSGIGLENVRKRLELLFPGKYDLQISSDESAFKVELKIDIRA